MKILKFSTLFTVTALLTLTTPAFGSSAKLSPQEAELRDEITVSGRYNLPKAKTSLQNNLNITSVLENESETQKLIAKTLKKNPLLFTQILEASIQKSLTNYGYFNVQNNETAADVRFDFSDITFEEKDDGTLAFIKLKASSPKECLNADVDAKFLSIKIKDTQKDRKVFAFIGVAALTALGGKHHDASYISATNRGYFLGKQLNRAGTLNKIKTYGEKVAIGEGYPHKRGPKTAKRYALKNAIRLSIARYMVLIDQQCA